jgi:hypothetical protein
MEVTLNWLKQDVVFNWLPGECFHASFLADPQFGPGMVKPWLPTAIRQGTTPKQG